MNNEDIRHFCDNVKLLFLLSIPVLTCFDEDSTATIIARVCLMHSMFIILPFTMTSSVIFSNASAASSVLYAVTFI